VEARRKAGLLFASRGLSAYSICGTHHEAAMLWTIFVILLVLWLLGIVSANTFGGFIHVLLALAIAVVLLRVIQDQRSSD
jgi:uncharacterized protein DUF5670